MVLFLYFKNRKESEDMKKMEQLANVKAFLCMVFGAIAGGFVNLIGGWSEDLTTLLIFYGSRLCSRTSDCRLLEKEQQVGKRGTE